MATNGFVDYQPGKGAHFNPKKVKQYGRELAKLEKRDGLIRPDRILDEARDPKSVFHDVFEWDDAAASEQHRLDTARRFIRWIEVEVRYVGSTRPKAIIAEVTVQRAFHNVRRPDGTRGYVGISTVACEDEYRRQLLDDCLRDVERLQEKAAVFRELKSTLGTLVIKIRKMLKSA